MVPLGKEWSDTDSNFGGISMNTLRGAIWYLEGMVADESLSVADHNNYWRAFLMLRTHYNRINGGWL